MKNILLNILIGLMVSFIPFLLSVVTIPKSLSYVIIHIILAVIILLLSFVVGCILRFSYYGITDQTDKAEKLIRDIFNIKEKE